MRDGWDLAGAAASAAGVRIARLQALRDTDAVNVVIQRIWGAQALGHELLRALQHAGCVFLGAREVTLSDDDGSGRAGPLAGFVLGFVGVDRGLHVHSHMLAVMPEWQGRGVGLALKLGQRAWTQDAAIPEVRWTYDPMLWSNARFNLARALMAKADTSGALDEFLRYLQAVPNDVQAHEFAGRLYASLGKLAESLPHFRKAVEIQPADATLQTNLGVALARAGDFQGAIAAFEAALKADPENKAAKQNLERARASLDKK